jgi:FKBP-type peptidyl-prolyl cis-trans isomerase
MNPKKTLTAGLICLGLVSPALAQDAAAPAPAAAPLMTAPVAPAFTEAQLSEEVGWVVAQRVGLTQAQFAPAEIDAILKGLTAALNGKESPYDLQKAGPEMAAFMERKQAAFLAKAKEKSVADAAAFFAKLQDNKNVVTTPSGLRYEIVSPGEATPPKATETVKVNYTGTLVDGTVFDSSVKSGAPAEFPLDGVIAGWTEGIQKIGKGGKIKLYVPPQLGYGDEGRPGIPPGSTLIFDVELLDIKPTPAAASAPAAAPTPPPVTVPAAAPPQG